MPVLAKEDSFFPHSLLDGEERHPLPPQDDLSVSEESRWWILHTRSRQEKAIARELRSAEIAHCLPLTAQNKFTGKRKVTSYLPIFNSYLFLYGTDDDRVSALKTNRVAYVLEVPDQLELERDLRQLKTLIEAEAALTVESKLKPGQRVRVKSGSFAGLEGTIISREKPSRLLVAVNYLQQGVSLQIDDYMLEAI